LPRLDWSGNAALEVRLLGDLVLRQLDPVERSFGSVGQNMRLDRRERHECGRAGSQCRRQTGAPTVLWAPSTEQQQSRRVFRTAWSPPFSGFIDWRRAGIRRRASGMSYEELGRACSLYIRPFLETGVATISAGWTKALPRHLSRLCHRSPLWCRKIVIIQAQSSTPIESSGPWRKVIERSGRTRI
jgi:hypothetical protein